MRCLRCGYELWNLTGDHCPECGSAYDLRHYWFEAGTVSYACQLCGHAISPEANGQPSVSGRQTCGGCGQEINTHTLRVIPLSPDIGEVRIVADGHTPWDNRESLGRWRAFWQTWALSIFRPGKLGPMLSGDPLAAWSYGCMVMLVNMGIVAVGLLVTLVSAAEDLGSRSLAGSIMMGGAYIAFAHVVILFGFLVMSGWPGNLVVKFRRAGVPLRLMPDQAILYALAPLLFVGSWLSVLLVFDVVWPYSSALIQIIWVLWTLLLAARLLQTASRLSFVYSLFVMMWLVATIVSVPLFTNFR